jgi:ribosome biogenesis protein MAK21
LGGNAIEAVAQTACREMTELLIERPEQEQFLLSAIVNKLGHPQHRVGAKVAQMLEQLVQKHPKMRPFVAKEVGILIFRFSKFPNKFDHFKII